MFFFFFSFTVDCGCVFGESGGVVSVKRVGWCGYCGNMLLYDVIAWLVSDSICIVIVCVYSVL